ncbi:MAG: polysaccharide biosynthesis protein, partial [Deltaproteobacteria bacterium]|nr:polysaccharide biosynthesis protein [Deltaproteobacteria bacterium]
EELLIEPEHALPTVHPRIFCSQEPCPESAVLEIELDLLKKAIAEQDLEGALAVMRRLVPEYGPLDQSQSLQEKPILNPSQQPPLIN